MDRKGKKNRDKKQKSSSYGRPSTTGHEGAAVGGGNKGESTYGAFGTPQALSQSVYRGGAGGPRQQQDFELGPAQQTLASKGYKVVDKLGVGNYARVFKVRGIDNKDYAVKMIDLEKTSKNYRVRFLPRELQILSQLNHKNICTIYEILQSGKMIFIFMEFAPNGTVADFLRQYKEIPEWMCKPMFAQILEALLYMHALNIAHRDMKLENILLDKHVNPKLTDFSYAVVVTQDSGTGQTVVSRTFCGSLPYLPPEILGETPYDPKVADVWSSGVCLFVMLNNTLPFKFNDVKEMLRCQMAREFKFKARLESSISELAKDCIRKMLEPDMSQRITTRDLMVHPWFTTK